MDDEEAEEHAARWHAALHGDRAKVLQIVAEEGRALQYAPDKFRGSRDVVLRAVRQDGQALQFALPKLRADRGVVLEAVRQDGHALRFASAELRADREMVLEAVRESWHSFGYAAEELKSDPDVVLQAVQEDGRVLRFAAEVLRNDRVIVLEAVKQHGPALGLASEELRGDEEVVLEAIRRDRRALEFLTEQQLRSSALSVVIDGFSVQVGLMSGSSYELQVYPEERISRLRQRVAELLKVDSWSIELCSGNERLQDGASVAGSSLVAGSVLVAIILDVQAGLDPYDIELLRRHLPGCSEVEAARALVRSGGDVIMAMQTLAEGQDRPFSVASTTSLGSDF